MSYRTRLTLLILLDSCIVLFTIFVAYWLVYPSSTTPYDYFVIAMTGFSLLLFHHLYAIIYNLYNKVWAYASVGELVAIIKAVTLTIVSVLIVQALLNDFVIYRRALFVTWMLHIILIGGSRFLWRMYRDRYIKKPEAKTRTLIVGAGDAGAIMARQLNNDQNDTGLMPVGFVDDDPYKQKMQLYGLPVIGTVKEIPEIVKNEQIEHIIIAIPSLKTSELQKIVAHCNTTRAKVQMIPKIEDLMTGKVSVSHLKNVEVEDLLGRDPVELDIELISTKVNNQVVMVTGAGGSIGSELCRQLIQFNPKQLILLDNGEYNMYMIEQELLELETESDIVPIIADVRERERIFTIVRTYRPQLIYHAAALKHVPLMEYNPHEAVKTNIIGTKNIAEAAAETDVDTFVLISTDKAVKPTNVMGATKRVSEMIVENLNAQHSTNFVAVRFGNVLGSRGSVIPRFREQIKRGGPVTVTDPRMTRYFMTIPEASRLVIQASTLATGGEIFVLDMGEPVKILDLAKNLIRLSGYTEDEIEIVFTGKRPGEKMYEELLDQSEIVPGQVYDKIYVGKTKHVDPIVIDDLLSHYEEYDEEQLKDVLMNIVFKERALLKAR